MKTLNALILSLFLFSFVACDKKARNDIREQFVQNVSTSTASVIASPAILNCAQEGVIQADIEKVLLKAPFLQPEELEQASNISNKSALTSMLCEQGIKYVIPLVVGSAIPSTWQCENTLISDLSDKLAVKVCDSM